MNRNLLLAFIAVAATSLACSIFVGGPDLPTPQVIPPAGALPTLESKIGRAVTDSVNTGTFSLQLTQEQLTAYAASKLSMQDPPVLTNPQVVLGDQKMMIYGRAVSGMVEANVSLAAEFSVTPAGQPEIKVTDAHLGPLPMPQALQDAIASALDEALTGSIGPAALGFRLESIDISGGVMTIAGRVR
jgi:hypothetical protein